MSDKYQQILGVSFFTGSPAEAVDIGIAGGLVVVPAAPALVEMPDDPDYCEALLQSDLAITDSGFMVLVWRFTGGKALTRVSGLEYLKILLERPQVRKPGAVLYIMPTKGSRDKCLAYLQSIGIKATEDDCYLAPMYPKGRINDPALIELIKRKRPDHIILGLGGGTQERLGLHIKQGLDYKPGIHCIGAAIGFLSGDQVPIPAWADWLFLGWAFRIASKPSRFFPRYWKARKLLPLMLKYKSRLPVAEVP